MSMFYRPSILADSYEAGCPLPHFAARASGANLWDVDGNRYLDFLLGFGCVVLGHSDDRVTEAVIEQMRRGVAPTLSSQVQCELAELLTEVIPGAQAVILLKTGSDATAAAIKIARSYTGRRNVLRWGYHGWHDWCANRPSGVIHESRQFTSTFDYNNIESLRRLCYQHKGDIAAVIMMPYELEFPAPGFLEEVRAVAHENGALFILDEVRSGFRISLGGAQEYFGITADIVTLSKAMANGHPISAVAGKREVLAVFNRLSLSSVFFRSPCEMAAALATIKILRTEAPFDRLRNLGEKLIGGLTHAASATGVPATGVGLGTTPFLKFLFASDDQNRIAMQSFCLAMLKKGILLHPEHHWFVCCAMSATDIGHAVECAFGAFQEVVDVMKTIETL